jgi:biopolymer transport protein ExbB
MLYITQLKRLMSYLPLVVASLFLFISLSAGAAWNEAWETRTKVAINTSEVTEAVTNALIPVRLHSGNFDFTSANFDGSDIRIIAADDKTELKFYVEKFDAINELAVIWVQVPQLISSNKDASFWIYTGNLDAPAAGNASIFADNSVMLKLSFSENTFLTDRSSQQLVVTGDATLEKAGLVGDSARINETPLVVAAKSDTDINQGYTWSAWIKPTTLPQTASLMNHGQLSLKLDADTLNLTIGDVEIKGGQFNPAVWHHVGITAAAGKASLYFNGNEVATGQISLPVLSGDIQIGENFVGEFDELETLNVAKSASWMKLVNNSLGVAGTLLTITAEESEEEGGEASYLGILITSLTIDAEIVIGILAIMFFISLWVMYAKAVVVVRTDKDNAVFLKRFQSANNKDLLNLDAGISLPSSTLLGLYKAGIREIRKRERSGEQLLLSGTSMDAIKAAVDADLVRETQRLNSMMVLLTIAISGGPFLGLLGTVVGVMITFAAIAAAGDVNVNAIAPGIAAALLATVAGLAVAIPALFGYNYLASRIKNITISMQIFVDEFVTRTAELFGKD